LAENFRQEFATLKSVAKDLVWLTVNGISQLDSRVVVGHGDRGEWGIYTTWLRWREQGRVVAFLAGPIDTTFLKILAVLRIWI
jgi:hypothetical protein